eukprot:3724354-Alexandrium_andersonii.AAC.2
MVSTIVAWLLFGVAKGKLPHASSSMNSKHAYHCELASRPRSIAMTGMFAIRCGGCGGCGGCRVHAVLTCSGAALESLMRGWVVRWLRRCATAESLGFLVLNRVAGRQTKPMQSEVVQTMLRLVLGLGPSSVAPRASSTVGSVRSVSRGAARPCR